MESINMCFWRKEKKEEIKEVYYVPFDCSNCHAPNMFMGIYQGVRVSEFIDEAAQKPVVCGKCKCTTSRKDGIKIVEKEKNG
jgi:hypothetical protein